MVYENNISESKKTLHVHIGSKIIKVIKESRYNLCMSKMVNNEYNVVWKSEANVRAKNSVEWTPSYAIYGVHDYKVGASTKACTTIQPIKHGEYCVLNPYGVLERSSGTPHAKSPMYIRNHYGATHVGISLQSEYGKDVPIYVTPEKCNKGIVGVFPKEKVLIWFEEKLEAGHIIKKVVSEKIEVDFSCEAHASIVFTNKGKWEIAAYE